MTWPEAANSFAIAFGFVGVAWAIAWVLVKKTWRF